jgi:hypothetical protein
VIWESEVNLEGCKSSAMQNAEPDSFCKITVLERKGIKGKGGHLVISDVLREDSSSIRPGPCMHIN